MHTLIDTNYFYQWDLDQRITSKRFKVGDKVQFANCMMREALTTIAYEHDGKVVADVPNILLQKAFGVTAYIYETDENGTRTTYEAFFNVKQRTKPADYVYTETEVLNYSTLLERIEELEEKEVEVDLTDYVKNTDYATTDKSGVVKVKSTYGTGVIESNGQLFIVAAEEGAIDAKSSRYKPITPAYLEYAVKSVGDGYYATEAQVGDIETALDSIIAIQNELIGG